MTSTLVAFVSALAVAACATDQDPQGKAENPSVNPTFVEPVATPPVEPPAPVPETTTFRFFVANEDGSLAAFDTFANEDLVYLDAEGTGAVAGDYAFDVIALVNTPSGIDIYYPSSGFECRTFHVAANGRIDSTCGGHLTGADEAGGLTIQLMPFEDIRNIVLTDDQGRRMYHMRVAPVGESLAGDLATSVSFYVLPPPGC
jgi:hypothetical protein